MKNRTRGLRTIWLPILLAAAFLACRRAPAAQFTTDTLMDDGSDHCLRKLVEGSQWGDVIILGVPGTITLTEQIVIDHDLTITAVGAPRDYLISGSGASRIFSASPRLLLVPGLPPPLGTGPSFVSGAMPTLTIANLTLCNGMPDVNDANYDWANHGTYVGGAIYVKDANLNLSACVLTRNHALYGSAIVCEGGGICSINGCTFSENVAFELFQSALDFREAVPGNSITRSTFSGNLEGGAAIQTWLPGPGITVYLTDCSIVSNIGGIDGYGIQIQNTIVARNASAHAEPDICSSDVRGGILSGGFNLIGIAELCSGDPPISWMPSDQVGSINSPLDPKLGPLADNGGPTPTHYPLTSPVSPAIDKGNSAASVDQRGYSRPYNFGVPNPPGNTSDIGAVEVQQCDFFGVNCTCLNCRTNPTVIGVPLGSPLAVAPTLPWPPCFNCPYSYQWLLNGTNIVGAITNTFSLTNAQLTNGGTYSLVASNGSGVVTAAVASVTVGYSLSVGTASNNSARILFSPYQGVYAPGSNVTLTAVPQYGWAFDYWSGDVLSANNPLTVFMNTNLSIVANLHYTNPPAGSQTLASTPGTALNFNGTNAFVRVPGFLTNVPTSEVTVEFWQNVSTAKAQSTFSASSFVGGSVFNAHVPYSDGKVYWDFGNINTSGRLIWTPPAPITNAWWHFALVASQSGNCMKLYTNGVLALSQTGMTPFVRSNLDLDIGGAASLGIPFGGLIDEFRIWNYARSESDIGNNMSRSIPSPQPGLVGYWRFDEGSGLTAADSSGFAHTGTLTNGTAWVTSTIPFVPYVTTSNGVALSDTNAGLNGIVNPNGSVATNWFEYGGSTNYSGITSPLTNGTSTLVSNLATRVPPGTLCHFRLVAMNNAGISFGQDSTFISPARLRIAPTNSNVLIAWPASALTFNLQRKFGIAGTNWVNVTNVTSVVSNENQVIISPLGTNAFYRLRYP